MVQRSPLWLVTQDPVLSAWVGGLQEVVSDQLAHPDRPHHLRVSLSAIDPMRDHFSALIRQGESRLHCLCAALCQTLLRGWEIHSVVIGEMPSTGERFTLVQNLHPDELSQLTDLDLGTRQLSKLRISDGKGAWHQPVLVANFLDYEPFELHPHGIFRIASRIKAEEEIWNKVVDELFHIDTLLKRDKQLRHLSRYVKDVFGLKIVVEQERVRSLHEQLEQLHFEAEVLEALNVPRGRSTNQLRVMEHKDYLKEPKESGWKAIKSVVRWWGNTFELQIQPLRNYLRERERLSRESHSSFRGRREEMRAELARRLPLYGFYRDLLRWLFLRSQGRPPELPGLTLELVD